MEEVIERDYLKVLNSVQRTNSYEIVELLEDGIVVKLSLEDTQTADDSKSVFEGEIYKCANFCAVSAVNEPNIFVINSNIDFLAQVEVNQKEMFFEAKALSSSQGKKFIEVVGKVNDITVFVGSFTVLKLDRRSKI